MDTGPSVREIAQMLNADARSLCRTLFPLGKEFGGFFNIGSVRGEAGDSMKVRVSGDRAGTWADYSCDPSDPEGKGDMLRLIELVKPWPAGGDDLKDIARAIRWAKGWLNLDTMQPTDMQRLRDRARLASERAERDAAANAEKKRLSAWHLWGHSGPLKGSPFERYLADARGIDFAALGKYPSALRFRGDVWCTEVGQKLPAGVSLFVGVDGLPKGVHITYLAFERGGWVKARLEHSKIIRSPLYWGAHIPIWKGDCGRMPLRDVPDGTVPRVSEGIEDALTIAMVDPTRRVVAAGTLGNIGALLLPDQVRAIELVGQHDAPGSKADESMEKQIARQQAGGRSVSCLWPDPAYKDFNDQLRGARMVTA